MSTIAAKPITAEAFFECANLPSNRDRHFELDRGEVIEMPPPGKHHGFICANISRIVGNFAIQQNKGYVCANDAGVIVERDPDTVRGPDVTFYDDDETADDMQRQYATAAPLLAVEVLSPHDRINTTMRRVTQLLNHGVAMVWVVDPEARDVSVCRTGKDTEVVAGEQTLNGYGVLPGFQCCVADIFAAPRNVQD